MPRNYRNYIAGNFLIPRGVDVFPSINPTDGISVLGVFPRSKQEDVNDAVEAAQDAYSAWRKWGMVKRSELLWEVAHLFQNNTEELARIIALESGKQINEARADVIEAFHMAQYAFAKGFEGERGKVFADEIPEKFCYETLEPKGVVVSITPWNFPMAIPMWLIALPLVYGNVVILKPSEETPLCAHKIAEIFDKALRKIGAPNGVFQVLHGMGDEVGWPLVAHPDTNTILFTGSYQVGAKIKLEVARHFNKNCAIETGSKSAVIVPNAPELLDIAVKGALASAFKTSGQRCVSAGRLIVEKNILGAFVSKFVEGARTIRVDNPLDESTFYGPMINKAGIKKVTEFNRIAKEEGAEVLLDRNQEPKPTPQGYWMRPFVYTIGWDRNARCLTEEAFGPHVAIIPAEDLEDALRIYNDTDYGLSAAVFTNNLRGAFEFLEETECGLTYVNLPCIGAGVRMAFGGIKKSGNLIPSAAGLIPAITHPKAHTINLAEDIIMAQGLNINK